MVITEKILKHRKYKYKMYKQRFNKMSNNLIKSLYLYKKKKQDDFIVLLLSKV